LTLKIYRLTEKKEGTAYSRKISAKLTGAGKKFPVIQRATRVKHTTQGGTVKPEKGSDNEQIRYVSYQITIIRCAAYRYTVLILRMGRQAGLFETGL
jgi:hypothetical protein